MSVDNDQLIDTVRESWSRALGCEVAADSNFFELGGDSLTALVAAEEIAASIGVEEGAADGLAMAIFDVSPSTPEAVAAYLQANVIDAD